MMIQGLGGTYTEASDQAWKAMTDTPWYCKLGPPFNFSGSCMPTWAADAYGKVKFGTVPTPASAGGPPVPSGWAIPEQSYDLERQQAAQLPEINKKLAEDTIAKIKAAEAAGTYSPSGEQAENWLARYWPLLAFGVVGVVMMVRK